MLTTILGFLTILLLSQTVQAAPLTTQASWYHSSDGTCQAWEKKGVKDCPTASGQNLYWLEAHTPYFAASWDYPLGTMLSVRRTVPLANHSKARTAASRPRLHVRVSDRGPARRLVRQGRRLDLSKAAFHAVCGDLAQGVCEVTVEQVR